MKKITIITATIIACVFVPDVQAGLILQNQFNGTRQIKQGFPLGQTFTAEDTNIASIGFNIRKVNNGTLPLTVELFEGVGNTGVSLGSSPILGLTEATDGFVDADFSFTTLTVGEIYTAILSADSIRWGIRTLRWEFLDDPYMGGDAIIVGSINPTEDLGFRVISIPEPTTMNLFFLGSLGLMRRYKNVKPN